MYNTGKNKQLHTVFPIELYKQLEQYAKKMNISVAAVIKIATTEFLKKHEAD